MIDEMEPGSVLVRFRRTFFVYQDRVGPAGAVELTFRDGTTLLLRVAGDGETLQVESLPWKLHFPEPVSDENEEFIWNSGKWEIVDVGKIFWSYGRFVGAELCSYTQDPRSVSLNFGHLGMNVAAVADETELAFWISEPES